MWCWAGIACSFYSSAWSYKVFLDKIQVIFVQKWCFFSYCYVIPGIMMFKRLIYKYLKNMPELHNSTVWNLLEQIRLIEHDDIAYRIHKEVICIYIYIYIIFLSYLTNIYCILNISRWFLVNMILYICNQCTCQIFFMLIQQVCSISVYWSNKTEPKQSSVCGLNNELKVARKSL